LISTIASIATSFPSLAHLQFVEGTPDSIVLRNAQKYILLMYCQMDRRVTGTDEKSEHIGLLIKRGIKLGRHWNRMKYMNPANENGLK